MTGSLGSRVGGSSAALVLVARAVETSEDRAKAEIQEAATGVEEVLATGGEEEREVLPAAEEEVAADSGATGGAPAARRCVQL